MCGGGLVPESVGENDIMQPAVVPKDRNGDIGTTVVATMRQLGVVALPRNYEIFYEALTGSNHELSLAGVSLSKRPSQEELDDIGRRFFTQNHSQSIVENAREIVARELEEVAQILRTERTHIEKYGRILDETSAGLNNRGVITRELLDKIVGVVQVATTSTLEHGKQVATTLGDRSAELESVKSKLEEYKKLADTDPLTQIWNRRAFDRRLTEVYASKSGVMFSALILVDIDRFKDINDRYGHPVGDKIIQIVASIFRGTVREDMFVARTGGEEFALIVEGRTDAAAFDLAERIRQTIENTPFVNNQNGVRYGTVTVSMGICMASEADSPDDLYAKADRALYRSKLGGRNRVTAHAAAAEPQSKNWMLYRKD